MLSGSVAPLDQRNQHIAEDDRIGNALCAAAEDTEKPCEDTKTYAENDLASGSDGACDIIRSHEECAEDQAAAAELSQHISPCPARSEDKRDTQVEGYDDSGDPDGDHSFSPEGTPHRSEGR